MIGYVVSDDCPRDVDAASNAQREHLLASQFIAPILGRMSDWAEWEESW
jgi:hypothetical protein